MFANPCLKLHTGLANNVGKRRLRSDNMPPCGEIVSMTRAMGKFSSLPRKQEMRIIHRINKKTIIYV